MQPGGIVVTRLGAPLVPCGRVINHNAFQEVHMIIKIKPIHRYEVTVNLENGNAGPQVAASNLTKAQAQNIAWALHDRAAKHHDEPEGIDVTLIDESQ